MLGVSPLLQELLNQLFRVVQMTGGYGVFVYGVLYRVLTAFGLHHILNNVFLVPIGLLLRRLTAVQSYRGGFAALFAGDPTAGVFMAGLFPIMMFALPAIAFAIIQEAREDLKPKIKKTFFACSPGVLSDWRIGAD
ncbi:PTS transporter subunit EIIC [Paenibacillus rhizoplanae]